MPSHPRDLQLDQNFIRANAARGQDWACESAKAIVAAHAAELAVRRQQLTSNSGYGLIDESLWLDEVDYFIEKCIGFDVETSHERFVAVRRMIDAVTKGFESSQLNFFNDMDPRAYERLVAEALADLGWHTQLTGQTGDQGVDVIASMRGKRVVIQCKRYSTAVGNAAVQQVFAGRAHEGAHFAVVVGSAGFTRSAVELAQSTGVILMHHDDLAMLELQIFGTASPSQNLSDRSGSKRFSAAHVAALLKITPINYEQFVADSLAALGWKTQITVATGYKDWDVIAERAGVRAIIQCYGFISPIDESHIQSIWKTQVIANADLAVVVSDQQITNGARDCCARSGVVILSHYELLQLTARTAEIKGARNNSSKGESVSTSGETSDTAVSKSIEHAA